ncbi:MAG: RNA 2',3'-cyclic phosphodiesterase [Aminipila sp.]
MRLFISINLNEQICSRIYDAICDIKQIARKGHFSRKENLHVTLAFLGEVNPNDLDKVKACMEAVNEEPFDIHIGGLGRFKRTGFDIYWIGIEKSDSMNELHKVLNVELKSKGFSVDMREFKPHLTLGREVNCDYQEAKKIVEELGTMVQPVEQFSLMLSERINGKLIYTELYTRNLTK